MGFREQIAPAFTEALKNLMSGRYLTMTPIIIRRQSAGTALTEDDVGLYYEIDPPDTQWARDIVSSIERGHCREFLRFSMSGGVENGTTQQTGIRTIKSVGNLYDVSPRLTLLIPKPRQGSEAIKRYLKSIRMSAQRKVRKKNHLTTEL